MRTAFRSLLNYPVTLLLVVASMNDGANCWYALSCFRITFDETLSAVHMGVLQTLAAVGTFCSVHLANTLHRINCAWNFRNLLKLIKPIA